MKLCLLAAVLFSASGSLAAPVLAPPADPGKEVRPFVHLAAGRTAITHLRIIDGTGGEPLRGTSNARVKTHLDHRIAMSMAVAGLASRDGIAIDDIRPIATSFPTFTDLLEVHSRA